MTLGALACSCLLRAGVAAVPVEIEYGVRVEGRERTIGFQGVDQGSAGEVDIGPQAALSVGEPDRKVALGYRPRLTLEDREGSRSALVQAASLVGRWRFDPAWLITGSAEGSYGKIGVLQLASPGGQQPGQAPAPAQPVPATASLVYQHVQVEGGVTALLGPVLRLELLAGAFLEGGADTEAQAALPLQRGLRGNATLGWTATALDTLGIGLTGSWADFSNGPDVAIGILTARWTHAHSAAARSWVAGGGSVTHERGEGLARDHVLPSGEIGAAYEGPWRGSRLFASVTAGYAPFVDRVTAAANERLGGGAVASLTVSDGWTFAAGANGGLVVGGSQARDSVWSGELRVARRVAETLELALGLRGVFQRQPRDGTRSHDWAVFASVGWRDRSRL